MYYYVVTGLRSTAPSEIASQEHVGPFASEAAAQAYAAETLAETPSLGAFVFDSPVLVSPSRPPAEARR